jgi:hypothetical protein
MQAAVQAMTAKAKAVKTQPQKVNQKPAGRNMNRTIHVHAHVKKKNRGNNKKEEIYKNKLIINH